MRYVAIAWKEGRVTDKEEPVRYEMDRTFNEMVEKVRQRRKRNES